MNIYFFACTCIIAAMMCVDAWNTAAGPWITPCSARQRWNINNDGRRRIMTSRTNKKTTQLNMSWMMLPVEVTSVLSGSIAGAVGVGVAFPLDTVKTKQQVDVETRSRIDYVISASGQISIVKIPPNNFSATVVEIWKGQGLGGFYRGVRTSMAGQALIKATAFGVNAAVLSQDFDIITAAAAAGFVTAFIAVPVDRIKVLMQADSYGSELECLQHVLDTEGVKGLLCTGLFPTFFREVPSYTLYFFLYEMLMSTTFMDGGTLSSTVGPLLAPLVSGAIAGACCVVPVHPVDVVKTIVQHSAITWQDAVSDIYKAQGVDGFWEGLPSRMGRAAVNHSVTFFIYDILVKHL